LAIERNLTSKEKAKISIKQLKNRMKINHPNILELKDFSIKALKEQ